MTVRLVCASANPAKAAEMARLLPRGVDLVPRPAALAETPETAATLEGNAVIKARDVASATGEWAVADDTGLCVGALSGEPGVRSARYAGEPSDPQRNITRLLAALEGVLDRSASFVTVVAVSSPYGAVHCVTGECAGRIADGPRGTGGFGYDSVFVPDEGDGRTFAEMSPGEKDAISHRGRALALLPPLLDRLVGL